MTLGEPISKNVAVMLNTEPLISGARGGGVGTDKLLDFMKTQHLQVSV